MPMWPFGRKGRKPSRIKTDGPEVVAEGKQPVASSQAQLSATVAGPEYPQGVGGKPSRRRSNRQDGRDSSPDTSQQKQKDYGEKGRGLSDSDLSPLETTSEKLPFRRGSVEDITALPIAKELGTSPHLRPVASDRADIPYNFQLNSNSPSNQPLAKERGKLQRPDNQKRQSGSGSILPLTKNSNKRSKEDHVREEELRAMSAPMVLPKRPAGNSGGLLRRDSKRMRGGLNRNFDRPTSTISLPLEDSIHSSMSGGSETHTFALGWDKFSPRPRIRLSFQPQYGSGALVPVESDASRSQSRRDQRPAITPETLNESRRIDELADNMDATDLREMMERDKRQKKLQEERLRQKLERRAEKQRAKELKKEQEAAAAADVALQDIHPALRDVHPALRDIHPALRSEQPDTKVGLGIEAGPSVTSQPPYTHRMPEDLGPTDTGTYLDPPSEEQLSSNPFADPSDPTSPPTEEPMPTEIPETPFEEPVISNAQAIRYSRASMTPPTSPTQHVRAASNISHLPELIRERSHEPAQERIHELAQEPSREASIAVSTQPTQSERRRSSDVSTGRRFGWPSFFKRSGPAAKAPSIDRGRATPSEMSFSNTSRESMSRRELPAHLVQQPQQQSRSGTPARKQSKFREDLAEMPVSPPDSRVQSPEVTSPSAHAIAARRGYRGPSPLNFEPSSSLASSSVNDPFSNARTDSPVTPARKISGLNSQSAASVVSEGSWLSGKLGKKPSLQALTRSIEGPPMVKEPEEDFHASYEDLGIPDDEYFRRLTPQPDDRRLSAHSGLKGHAKKPSSTAIGPGSDSDLDDDRDSLLEGDTTEETVKHGDIARLPTVVRREDQATRVKSREGLLNFYREGGANTADSPGASSTDESSPERESPSEEGPSPTQRAFVERARSVDLGKGHIRAVSAGSAKLLDIPARSGSGAEKRSSFPGQNSRHSTPML
ncbi:hypothetical protein H2199_003455 [Coniosporium tulheliwenetii]|uniref:Uncharacterized protein n=1 Tax=Coniosporium tulheliwenetii TaxID=3383036 RepID=A0ACC2ZB76_9PEZI|nr:hypothetical protein H2199_003455 [Cladosporium sp. JES 115]